MKDRFFVIACLVIPLLFLLPGYSSFIFPAGSEYSDLIISHYPNLIYLKNSLVEWRQIPLWSNTILSGYPFAADPLSGLWYPFIWLLLVLPQPFGFNLVISIHIFLGGLGIYLCLGKSGIQKFGAILGAVSFEMMPKLVAHYAAGHITMVYAVCLTPWIVYAETMYQTKSNSTWRFASGMILGLIALADIRWTPYAGLLFVALRIANYYKKNHTFQNNILNYPERFFNRAGALIKETLPSVLVAVGVSAGVWLPLFQYSVLSTRSAMSISERLALSLPPARLLGFLFPDLQGYCEWVFYPGALGLLSLAAIIFSKKLWKFSSFWIFVLFISFFWSLGFYNPLMQYIFSVPGINWLRVPARALFMTGIAFSMLIGIFADQLLGQRQMNKWMKLAVLFICVLAVGLCIGVCVITHKWNIEFLWGAGFCVLVAGIFLIITGRKTIPVIHVFAILFCLLILDMGAINFVNMDFRSKESILNEKSLLGDWFSKQAGQFRVYSPSYSIPQLTAVHSGLELADGINPMQLQIYDNFMRTASGVPGEEYSVTLPRFSTGRPDVDNQYSVLSPQLLGFLNVKYICSDFPLSIEGLEFVKRIDSTWIYENRYMQNRVWMQKTPALTAGESEPLSNQLTIEKYEPNQILIHSNGEEGILVLSEIMYPGWKVTVDGKQANMTAVGGLLRGVEISAGEHEVEFIFRPVLVYLGAGISIFTLIVIIFFIINENKSTGKNV